MNDAWAVCKQQLGALARDVGVVLAVGTALTSAAARGVPELSTWLVVTFMGVPAFLLGHRERPYQSAAHTSVLGLPFHMVVEAGLMLGHGAWAYPKYVFQKLWLLVQATLVFRLHRKGLVRAAAEARAAAAAEAAHLNSLVVAEAYAALGLVPGADIATVKRAYRRRMHTVHPDKTQHLDAAQRAVTDDAATRLNKAYDTICAHLGGAKED